MLEWIQRYSQLWAWLALVSTIAFVVSLLLIPWLLLRLPADCFMPHVLSGSDRRKKRPLLHRLAWRVFRNVLGYVLMGFGVVMLFLPGQGILTLLAGGALARFPYKKRLMGWILSRDIVRRSLNGLRQRYDREPFQFPESLER